jgi:lipoprotein-releasing system ATP-binding protein
MSSLLELRDIRKSYGSGAGTVEVLKGISMTVTGGETIALVGASGAGKTTLLHIIGALDLPTAGTIMFQGEEIFRRSETALASFRNRTIGFVFQFHHLLPEFTALENVMLPGLINRKSRREVEGTAEELLRKVGLAHRLTHRPTELSGGEQQRVAIARALVQSPTLLLADEPTGNLDRKTSEEVHDVLRLLHDELGLTLIIVTHNERLAASMGKIIQLEDGRIS